MMTKTNYVPINAAISHTDDAGSVADDIARTLSQSFMDNKPIKLNENIV